MCHDEIYTKLQQLIYVSVQMVQNKVKVPCDKAKSANKVPTNTINNIYGFSDLWCLLSDGTF